MVRVSKRVLNLCTCSGGCGPRLADKFRRSALDKSSFFANLELSRERTGPRVQLAKELHNRPTGCGAPGQLCCIFRRETMKPALCCAVLGLTLASAHACQQIDPSLAKQAATPPAAPPATTPARDETPPNSASATPPAVPSPSEAGSIDSALQTQIQEALNKDPIFSQGHLKVTVSSEGIELSGEVPSGRDRQNAARMAQSYARGKKVVNRIVVRGHSVHPNTQSPENQPANSGVSAGPAGASGPP